MPVPRIVVIGASYRISESAGHSSILDLIRFACPNSQVYVLESSRYFAKASRQTRGSTVYIKIPKRRLGSQSTLLGWLLTLETFFRLLRELIAIRPKLLHLINLDSAIMGVIYRTLVNRQCLWVYHAMDIYAYLHVSNRLVRAILLSVERAMANSANLAITVSEDFATLLGIHAPLIVYPGIVPKYDEVRALAKAGSRFPKSEEETWIMCSGIIHRKRGLEKIISFAQRLPGVVKVICTGPIAADYRKDFERLLTTNALKHVGFLDRDEYRQVMTQSDFVAIPYDPDEYYQFAPTFKFFEALLFRRPVIASMGTKTGKQAERLGVGIAMDLSHPNSLPERVNELEAARTRLVKEDYYARFAERQISSFADRYRRLFAER